MNDFYYQHLLAGSSDLRSYIQREPFFTQKQQEILDKSITFPIESAPGILAQVEKFHKNKKLLLLCH